MFGQAEEERQHQQQMMVIKGKRTKCQRPASPLTPLVAMSNSSSSHDDVISTKLTTTSSSSTTTATTQEEEDMAHCLILLAQGGGTKLVTHQQQQHQQQQTSVGVMYECKTCNRCFSSFQALGGHRPSHKKPKMTPPSEPSGLASGMGLSLQLACNSSNTLRAISFNPNQNLPNKPKSHACGICGAEFSSGQALGGHMRRHRPLVAGGNPTPATPPAINLQLCLDLNLPAEEEENQEAQTPKFLFGSNENALVFTTGALVECRY